MRIFSVAFILALFCMSCYEEDHVDADLIEYLEQFKEEAALRNIKVDYERKPVEARLEIHPEEVALGWCNHDFDNPNKVTINLIFWNVLNALEKEKLIFHELGHCVLDRPHLDRMKSDGYCKSIMHSGQACADNYSVKTRKAYLDELFTRK